MNSSRAILGRIKVKSMLGNAALRRRATPYHRKTQKCNPTVVKGDGHRAALTVPARNSRLLIADQFWVFIKLHSKHDEHFFFQIWKACESLTGREQQQRRQQQGERVRLLCVAPQRQISSSNEQTSTRTHNQALTFDFFIWNDRSKSSVCESLFYFTSTGRKGVVIILCAHIQCLSQQYPSRGEKSPKNKKKRRKESVKKCSYQTFKLCNLRANGVWHLAHLSTTQIQTLKGSQRRSGTARRGRELSLYNDA